MYSSIAAIGKTTYYLELWRPQIIGDDLFSRCFLFYFHCQLGHYLCVVQVAVGPESTFFGRCLHTVNGVKSLCRSKQLSKGCFTCPLLITLIVNVKSKMSVFVGNQH